MVVLLLYQDTFRCEVAGGLGEMTHRTYEDGTTKSVFHFQVPLAPDKEEILFAKYGIPFENRLAVYQNLVFCIQHNIQVSSYLRNANVPSILSFSNVEQEQKDDCTHIYLESEKVWPIREKHLKESVPRNTLVDIIYRLSLILRFNTSDTKEAVGVIHRGFDLNEVFINESSKILLGGFYYASCPGMEAPPEYMPHKPANLPSKLLHGEFGSQGTDIQTLARLAWNLFSGLPYDAPSLQDRLVFPEFATEEILSALLIGLSGDETQCNSFRRKFSEARKQLMKSEDAEKRIPIRTSKQKQYEFGFL